MAVKFNDPTPIFKDRLFREPLEIFISPAPPSISILDEALIEAILTCPAPNSNSIDFADKERVMFWKEVFNSDEVVSFEDALDSYELLRDYLFETFQDVDDWEQLTFYKIDWEAMHKEDRNILVVQLTKPLSAYWEEIIIPRMKQFFELKIYEYMDKDAELTGITLCSEGHNPIKSY